MRGVVLFLAASAGAFNSLDFGMPSPSTGAVSRRQAVGAAFAAGLLSVPRSARAVETSKEKIARIKAESEAKRASAGFKPPEAKAAAAVIEAKPPSRAMQQQQRIMDRQEAYAAASLERRRAEARANDSGPGFSLPFGL